MLQSAIMAKNTEQRDCNEISFPRKVRTVRTAAAHNFVNYISSRKHCNNTMRIDAALPSRKVVVVGDGDTGKTSMLYMVSKGTFPETHVPTIMETEVVKVAPATRPGHVAPPPIDLVVWDTAGQEDYDRLRPLAYGKTDVFLVCFRCVSQVLIHETLFIRTISTRSTNISNALLLTEVFLTESKKDRTTRHEHTPC